MKHSASSSWTSDALAPTLPGALFADEHAATEFLEKMRWPDGITCPRCQSANILRMGGKTQVGMLLCRNCRNKFTCRQGTTLERSHIPLHKWLIALNIVTQTEEQFSPQIMRTRLGLGSYRSAWLLVQRIRNAFRRRFLMLRSSAAALPTPPAAVPATARSRAKWQPTFDEGVKAVLERPTPDAEDGARRVRAERA